MGKILKTLHSGAIDPIQPILDYPHFLMKAWRIVAVVD